MAKAINKPTESEQVASFMDELDHPLKTAVNAVRRIIKATDERLQERIKWAAPSYYFKGKDLVTFNLRTTDKVMLVFHHVAIVDVESPLLEGSYKDRRLMYFAGIEAVQQKQKELERIMQDYLQRVNADQD